MRVDWWASYASCFLVPWELTARLCDCIVALSHQFYGFCVCLLGPGSALMKQGTSWSKLTKNGPRDDLSTRMGRQLHFFWIPVFYFPERCTSGHLVKLKDPTGHWLKQTILILLICQLELTVLTVIITALLLYRNHYLPYHIINPYTALCL